MTGLAVRIWGCRGSLPVPGPATHRYGGDTSCYEIEGPGVRLVIDCGSGLRALGQRMLAEGPPAGIDMLLTHPHFDHLIGLGFFAPLIKRRTAVTLWSAMAPEDAAAALRRLYSPPLWPATIPGDYPVALARLGSGPAAIGAAEVTCFPLNHPGGATGFRIEAAGRAVCIVCDHEHGDAAIDAAVERAVRGADLMIYDAAYTETEYRAHRGWGHSTRAAAEALSRSAGVRHTLLVHHAIQATDVALDDLADSVADGTVGMTVARDGLEIVV
jgi:phosphoribosyl 1,2-cyclic phosphodiesterase